MLWVKQKIPSEMGFRSKPLTGRPLGVRTLAHGPPFFGVSSAIWRRTGVGCKGFVPQNADPKRR